MAFPSNVYSYCFYRNAGLVGAQSLAIPSGYTAVLKHLRAYSGLGPVTGNILNLEDGGTGALMVRFDPSNIDASGSWSWSGVIVMGTGSNIILRSLQNPKDIVLSGFLLFGVAPVQIVGAPVP